MQHGGHSHEGRHHGHSLDGHHGGHHDISLGSKRGKDIRVMQAGRVFHTKRQKGYYEGTLTKSGGSILTNWKERHFRLKGTALAYFEDSRSEQPKGEIHFHSLTKLVKIKDGPKPHMFSVSGWKDGGERVLELSARSHEERDFWLEAIDAALHEGYAKFDYPEYWFRPFYPHTDLSMWLGPKVQLETGDVLMPREAERPPAITHSCADDDCEAFALFMADFGFPTFDKFDSKVFLHWGLVNIPNHHYASSGGKGRARGITRTKHQGHHDHGGDAVPHHLPDFLPQQWTKASINSEGAEVLPYIPPAAPYHTGKHRYVLMLFKQKFILHREDLSELLAPFENRPEARVLPNLQAFFQLCHHAHVNGDPIAVDEFRR
jgi:phosphatidylethanolamine-binding protein (PEBP) family uncharacterized protein